MRGLDEVERAILKDAIPFSNPDADDGELNPEEDAAAERLVERDLCVWEEHCVSEDEYFWVYASFLRITDLGRQVLVWDAMAKGSIT